MTRKRQDDDKVMTTEEEYKEREEGKKDKNNNTPYNPPRYFPNDENLDKAITDFVKYRKEIKKPLTDKGIELTIKRLNKLSGGDNDKAIRIIEQSISQGWQGLFELHEGKQENVFDAWQKA